MILDTFSYQEGVHKVAIVSSDVSHSVSWIQSVITHKRVIKIANECYLNCYFVNSFLLSNSSCIRVSSQCALSFRFTLAPTSLGPVNLLADRKMMQVDTLIASSLECFTLRSTKFDCLSKFFKRLFCLFGETGERETFSLESFLLASPCVHPVSVIVR